MHFVVLEQQHALYHLILDYLKVTASTSVLQTIVYNSMLKHVEESLIQHQFGFLPNRSTLQQLLTFTNEILKAKMWRTWISGKLLIWCFTMASL